MRPLTADNHPSNNDEIQERIIEMAEQFAYRENLEQILQFSGGKQLLSITEVGRFTGLVDQRAIKRRFPFFVNGKISAATLARCLCGGGKK